MKKIFIVSTAIRHGHGGIQTALQGYCDGLTANNIEYDIVTSHKDNDNFNLLWPIALFKVFHLALKNRGSNTVFWFHSGPWLSMTRKFTLAMVAKLFGCEVINHLHSPVLDNYLNNRFQKAALGFLLLPYKKLIVLTPWWKRRFQENGFKQDLLISANPDTLKLCQQAESSIASKTEKTIPSNHSGNNLHREDARADKISILTMARLKKGKGIELVIGAMKQLPDHYTLTIAGSGPLEDKLKLLAGQSGLTQRIQFTGWVSQNNKQQLFESHTLLCLPSRYDSFGMIFIEAMAYNMPVIGLNWGPMSDVITNDVGLLCNKPSEDDVAKNIQLIVNSINNYHNAGAKKVLSDFHPVKIAQCIIKFIETQV